MENEKNPELTDLGTHAAGVTDLHKARTTSEVHTINPPVSSPGVYDNRHQTNEDE